MQPSIEKPLALVVDDEKPLAEIFATALERAGYRTESVNSGEAALARLAEITPAVVVLDLTLPDVGGAEILKEIRANPRLAKTRVIIASAQARQAEALRGKADLILIKPVDFSQLRDLAARLRLATGPLDRDKKL